MHVLVPKEIAAVGLATAQVVALLLLFFAAGATLAMFYAGRPGSRMTPGAQLAVEEASPGLTSKTLAPMSKAGVVPVVDSLVPPLPPSPYTAQQPFVVLSTKRSGSTLFMHLLKRHPDIFTLMEPYNKCNCNGDCGMDRPKQHFKPWHTSDDACKRRFDEGGGDMAFRDFIYNEVAAGMDKPSVGFKIQEQQLTSERLEELFMADPHIKVVVLVRSNLLTRYISERTAYETKSWWGKTYPDGTQVEISRQGMEDYSTVHDAYYNDILKMLVKHNKEAFYASYDMYSDPSYAPHLFNQLFHFLGLRSNERIAGQFDGTEEGGGKYTPQVQQSKGHTQRDRVNNYDALREQLRGTKYEKYFK